MVKITNTLLCSFHVQHLLIINKFILQLPSYALLQCFLFRTLNCSLLLSLFASTAVLKSCFSEKCRPLSPGFLEADKTKLSLFVLHKQTNKVRLRLEKGSSCSLINNYAFLEKKKDNFTNKGGN